MCWATTALLPCIAVGFDNIITLTWETHTVREWPTHPHQPVMCRVILCSNLKVGQVIHLCFAQVHWNCAQVFTLSGPGHGWCTVHKHNKLTFTHMRWTGSLGELNLSPKLWCDNTVSGWTEVRDKRFEGADRNRLGTDTERSLRSVKNNKCVREKPKQPKLIFYFRINVSHFGSISIATLTLTVLLKYYVYLWL